MVPHGDGVKKRGGNPTNPWPQTKKKDLKYHHQLQKGFKPEKRTGKESTLLNLFFVVYRGVQSKARRFASTIGGFWGQK